MTGAELRAARKAAELSQIDLALRAGIGRHAVQYHESRDRIDLSGWAIGRIRAVLGVEAVPEKIYIAARARDMAVRMAQREQLAFETAQARAAEIEAEAAAKRRVRCGAMTRKGTPCRGQSEPGKRRCKFHGGKSTGARTPEGIERIREAQRRRWVRWRAERGMPPHAQP